MPDKSVELRLILSGIFLMSDFFDKYSAVSICAPFSGYGQNRDFWDLPGKAGPRQQKTRRGKCLLREKGYVIGEITALEVAVITYIKRGEGWYLISLCLYDTSDNLRNVSDLF